MATTQAPSFWAQNLRFLRNRKKLSQEAFAEQFGITRAKLNAHENGKTINPTVDDLVSFSSFFGLSIDTLIKVDLASLSAHNLQDLEDGNDAFIIGRKLRILTTTVNAVDKQNIEFVPIKARAGYLAGHSDPEFIAALPRFTMPHLPADKTYRMFPTTGRSMLPIPEGSLVIAEYIQDWFSLKNDTLCILILKSSGPDFVFKQVANNIKASRSLTLKSLNTEEFKPYEVPVGDVLEIWKFISYISNEVPVGNISMSSIASALNEIRVDIKRFVR